MIKASKSLDFLDKFQPKQNYFPHSGLASRPQSILKPSANNSIEPFKPLSGFGKCICCKTCGTFFKSKKSDSNCPKCEEEEQFSRQLSPNRNTNRKKAKIAVQREDSIIKSPSYIFRRTPSFSGATLERRAPFQPKKVAARFIDQMYDQFHESKNKEQKSWVEPKHLSNQIDESIRGKNLPAETSEGLSSSQTPFGGKPKKMLKSLLYPKKPAYLGRPHSEAKLFRSDSLFSFEKSNPVEEKKKFTPKKATEKTQTRKKDRYGSKSFDFQPPIEKVEELRSIFHPTMNRNWRNEEFVWRPGCSKKTSTSGFLAKRSAGGRKESSKNSQDAKMGGKEIIQTRVSQSQFYPYSSFQYNEADTQEARTKQIVRRSGSFVDPFKIPLRERREQDKKIIGRPKTVTKPRLLNSKT